MTGKEVQEIQYEKEIEETKEDTPHGPKEDDNPTSTMSYRKYTSQERKDIINCHISYGKEYTMVKYGIKEGTFNSLITKYNSKGDEAFQDHRAKNGGKSYSSLDEPLLKFIKTRRELFLPVTLQMLTKEAVCI